MSCSGCDDKDNNHDNYEISLKWKYQLYPPNAPDLHDSRSQTIPLIIDDNIYITYNIEYPYKYRIGSFNINSGEQLWYYESDRSIETTRFKNEGDFIYTNIDDSVICLDRNNGQLVWGVRTNLSDGSGEIILSDNFILSGRGYYDSLHTTLYKLDKNNGNFIWKKYITSINRCVINFINYDSESHLTYIGLHVQSVVGVNPNPAEILCLQDSTILWRRTFNNLSNAIGPSVSSFIKDDWLLFGVSSDFLAVNKYNGDSIWAYKGVEGHFDAPILLNDKLYSTNINGSLYCLNALNGKLLWRHYLYGSQNKMITHDDKYIYSCNGALWVVNQTTGKIVLQMKAPGYETDNGCVFLSPVGINQNHIIIIGTRAVYCFTYQ